MTDAITLFVESDVVPGKLDELKDVIGRLIDHIGKTEPDTLIYSWHLNEAGTEVRVVEHYANSDAVRFHAKNYASFAKELASLRKIKKFNVCGNPDPSLLEAFSAVDPEVFSSLGGHFKQSLN